jgi:CRISPR-associated endoribonuclease Cas6
MEETLRNKMRKAGIPDDATLQIEFDLQYVGKKIKMVNYRNIRNKTNWCPLIIKGKPETKLFAWNVGIGNSTGIGFGSIF